MVCQWKPNSSRDPNDPRMPNNLEGPPVPAESDESMEDEELNNANFGAYQLLPTDMLQGLSNGPDHASDDNDSDDASDDSNGACNEEAAASGSQPDPSHTPHQLEGWERSEIKVDCDEIRSLMSGFSLPSTSVPDWASSVPESAFTNFVWDRLQPNQPT